MNLFKRLFVKKRRFDRIAIDSFICGFFMETHGNGADKLEYGPCDVFRLVNLSSLGLALRHENTLRKGDIIEFHSKYCIKDDNCFSCSNFPKVEERLSLSPFKGRVIWRNDFMAGFNFTDIKDKDREYLEKVVISAKL